MARDLPIIEAFYDLTLYLTGRIGKFPRHLRHGLGLEIEGHCRGLLADFIRGKLAPAGPTKIALLRQCNIELEVLRIQLRLARDLAALPNKSQEHALLRLQDIGGQLGGWLKSLERERRP